MSAASTILITFHSNFVGKHYNICRIEDVIYIILVIPCDVLILETLKTGANISI